MDRYRVERMVGSGGMAHVLAAKHIELFWEAKERQALLEKQISKMLATAEQVVFLGFGFHPENVRILASRFSPMRPLPAMLGTSLGLSKTLKTRLEKQFDGLRLFDCDAATLLYDHVELQ